jgi:hypothetical protein
VRAGLPCIRRQTEEEGSNELVDQLFSDHRDCGPGLLGLAAKQDKDHRRGGRSRCAATQKESALNRQAGVTEKQIEAYCDCYINALADVIAVDEIRSMLNGKVSDSLQEKIDQVFLR